MELQRLGKYEIRGILGKGAMGTVYDGYDPRIDRRVAIKTMQLPDQSDEEGMEGLARFRREAQAAGRLNHPNIVGVFDYGEEDPVAYIVMEYAPGTELKKILDRGDRLPIPEVLRIMENVLEGLQFSHSRGVVHRDIKPGNIILAEDGTIKIADFGIARVESSQMTQAGTVMGTPAYMSPEQFMGQPVDNRSDIYSAGAMFYQLLTGERPFDGGRTAIMHKALNTEPPRPSELSVTSPVALDAVVAKAMAKRPEARFESAAAFAQAIRDAMASGRMADAFGEATIVRAPVRPSHAAASIAPTPAAADKLKTGGSRTGLYAGIAVIVVLLLGAGGYFLLGSDKSAEKTNVASAPSVPVAGQPNTPQSAVPAPVPVPALTTEQQRDALNASFATAKCSLVRAHVSGQSLMITGIVERGQRDALVADPAAKGVGAWKVDAFDEPTGAHYCDLLDALHPIAATPLPVSVSNGMTDLRKDAEIVPDVTMPNFASWLYVDYISNDGSVVHLYPTASSPARLLPAGAVQKLGVVGTVDVPYGVDMIVGIASERPLFDDARPPSETLSAYQAGVQAAIAEAQRQGVRMSAGVVMLHTSEK